jgi:tRNA A-37 threonylcarbamoyl transferase component Bud32/predicted nucleotidyltransferase
LRKLNQNEVEQIQSTLGPIIEKKKIRAICVYGSQVSGYARADSDYDAIAVVTPFLQRIKYYYLKGNVQCSALVVEENAFENDCLKSSLGEFVAGRLLNPYYVLGESEFLLKNEIAYKRRVIIEGLSEAYSENPRFAYDIEFPLSYFLYEKLRKRASIYPPVVYSYAKTYSENLKDENVEFSLVAFRNAAVSLESEGLINFDKGNDIVNLRGNQMRSGLAAKLSSTASLTTRGIRQYAVHGYAGRVGFDVVGREVISKLERSKERIELPKEITSPKSSWKLRYGKLFADSQDWLSDFMEYFGMDKNATNVTMKPLGEIYNSSSFYTLKDSSKLRKSLSIAVKRYSDVKGMKWGLLSIWSLKNTNFTANPFERMHREYRALEQFRSFGIPTPEILALFLSEKILITKFIRGKNLSSLQSEYLEGSTEDLSRQREFGSILAKVHGAGSCIGDTKPSNAILSDDDGKIYLTDLEQAHARGNFAWDIAEYIYYSVRFTLKEERARKLVKEFVSGYLEGGGNPGTIHETADLRYRAPFQTFIAPNVLNALRKDLTSSS